MNTIHEICKDYRREAAQQGNLPTGIDKNNGCKLSDVPHNGFISGCRES